MPRMRCAMAEDFAIFLADLALAEAAAWEGAQGHARAKRVGVCVSRAISAPSALRSRRTLSALARRSFSVCSRAARDASAAAALTHPCSSGCLWLRWAVAGERHRTLLHVRYFLCVHTLSKSRGRSRRRSSPPAPSPSRGPPRTASLGRRLRPGKGRRAPVRTPRSCATGATRVPCRRSACSCRTAQGESL